MNFHIYQIPLWTDNYIYLLNEKKNNKTVVIDPGESKIVDSLLKKQNLKLDFIFITHHHYDHTSGVKQLKKNWNCPVYGYLGDKKRIPEIDHGLQEGDSVFVGDIQFEIMYLPGHTLGHIAFWNPKHQILFCGDTLFAMGCGYLFEGSFEQMFSSLNKIKKLPKSSKIYCAHEYSLKNAQFALERDPLNKHLKKRLETIKKLRSKNQATVPFSLEEELLTNPFLRAKSVSEFAKIRKQRNSF